MNEKHVVNPASPPTLEEATKRIEETAYFHWLNRGRYAQPGNELQDWLAAEKELRAGLKAPL